ANGGTISNQGWLLNDIVYVNENVTYAQNGQTLKYFAVNECDSVVSNGVEIIVNQQPVFITCPDETIVETTVPGELSIAVNYIVEIDNTTLPIPEITYLFEGATEGMGIGTGSNLEFNVGITTVTVTAFVPECDAITCVFDIEIIEGNEPPQINCSEIIDLFADENGVIMVSTDSGINSYTHVGDSWNATATDDVTVQSLFVMITNITTNQILVSYDDELETLSGFTFYFGYDYEIIWRATDHAGLYAECDFVVRVIDTESPVIGGNNGVSCESITNYQNIINICLSPLENVYTHYGIDWDITAIDNIGVSSITYEITGATEGSGTSLNGVVFSLGTSTVTWTATDINNNESSCSFDVVITSSPFVNIENFIYCAGDEAPEYTFTGSENTTFIWQRIFGADIGLAVNSGINTIPAFTAVNEGYDVITATYQVIPQSNNACSGEIQYFIITVNPNPTTAYVEDMVYCNGETAPAYYFTNVNPNVNHEWEFVAEAGSTMIPGIPISGNNFIPEFNALNTSNTPLIGKYRVKTTLTFANLSCGDDEWTEFSIIILPTPQVPTVNPSNQVICSGDMLEDINFNSNIDEIIFSWTRISGLISELPAAGTGNISGMIIENNSDTPLEAIYEVKAILNYADYPAYNCESNTTQFSIIVNPSVSTAPVNDFVYCSGETTTLYEFSGNNPMSIYEWEFVDGDVLTGIPVSGINYFPSFVTLNNENRPLVANYRVRANYLNCFDPNWQEFSVTILPVPTVIVEPVNQTICSGMNTEEIEFSSNIDNVIFRWTRISGIIPNLPSEGEGEFGSFVVENTGLEAISATYQVTPVLNYEEYPGYECPGISAQFIITVLPDITINTIPDMIYCNGELAQSYKFGNNQNVVYTWKLIEGENVGLIESGSGDLPMFTAVNNSNNKILEAIYEVTAIFNLRTHKCIETKNFSIIVNPTPTLNLNIDSYVFCDGEETEIIDFVSKFMGQNNHEATMYHWEFVAGDNIGLEIESGINTIPSFVATNNSNQIKTALYKLSAVFEDCSSDSRDFMIAVRPKPTMTSLSHYGDLCSGENINYHVTTSLPVDEITWTRMAHPDINNNESSSGSGNYIKEKLINNGTSDVTVAYTITMKEGDCDIENTAQMFVVVKPNLNMSLASIFVGCYDNETVVVDYENNLENLQYKLLFEEEAILAGFVSITQFTTLPDSFIEIPMPGGVATGNYPATLIVNNEGCEQFYNIVIVIKTTPTVTAMFDYEMQLCDGDEINLIVNAEGNVEYQWYFNNEILIGETGASFNAIFDESKVGEYKVSVTNECGSSYIVTEVKANPLYIEMKWNDILFVDNNNELYESYQWYKNDYPISQHGESQYYTESGGFTADSEYYVRAFKSDGSFDESCPFIPNPSSSLISPPKIIVYPNPVITGNNITILLEMPAGHSSEAYAYIIDVNGKKIQEFNIYNSTTTVSINVASGTYFVRVYTKDGFELVEKIFIQK
ncbi:T9SS type A sorting domain-containing protein, partial [Bacteroidales bacterium OttesenSCG-928-K03]|nr:T9SS type A sorting domain-containing protein [Odoribacter sp. OttesenSCG-928-L07]MDL2242883.1 T9SS type A sorting domain-containing protein [Bacteroidales bacterium OttesenSCG-928-K03]